MKEVEEGEYSGNVEEESEEESPAQENEILKNKEKGKKKKLRVVANVLNTDYDVVKNVLKEEIGCHLIYTTESDTSSTLGNWDLYWSDTGMGTDFFSKLRDFQKVNHFPEIACIARKNQLGKNLMRMRRAMPTEYNFFPGTWMLPLEINEFKKILDGKPKTFIVKPEAMSQGRGIYLARSLEEINSTEHCVVQRYINKPYLMDGLKFDLRIYVLVYGCDPLRIFLFKEGLARLSTEPYSPPDAKNMENMYMHLTNYAINKHSENFEFNTDAECAGVGNKRSLTATLKYIQ